MSAQLEDAVECSEELCLATLGEGVAPCQAFLVAALATAAVLEALPPYLPLHVDFWHFWAVGAADPKKVEGVTRLRVDFWHF